MELKERPARRLRDKYRFKKPTEAQLERAEFRCELCGWPAGHNDNWDFRIFGDWTGQLASRPSVEEYADHEVPVPESWEVWLVADEGYFPDSVLCLLCAQRFRLADWLGVPPTDAAVFNAMRQLRDAGVEFEYPDPWMVAWRAMYGKWVWGAAQLLMAKVNLRVAEQERARLLRILKDGIDNARN